MDAQFSKIKFKFFATFTFIASLLLIPKYDNSPYVSVVVDYADTVSPQSTTSHRYSLVEDILYGRSRFAMDYIL